MRKLNAIKLRVTLYLVPVALFCFVVGFVIGENMAPKMKSCSITINPGWDNYGKSQSKADGRNTWY